MKKRYNDVECFMYYMCNSWNLEESKRLFGDSLGAHIFFKYAATRSYADTLYWYGELDKECRDKISNRAIELYRKY